MQIKILKDKGIGDSQYMLMAINYTLEQMGLEPVYPDTMIKKEI